MGRNWVSALLALSLASLAWLVVMAVLSLLLGDSSGWSELFAVDAETARELLGNFPEVIIAVLGIIITVVSITLQLAATRYTHRITEMFFHDQGNLAALAFYVVASVHCVVAAILVRTGVVPQVLLVSTLLIVALTVLLLVPYFIYVFAFLDPARLVVHLRNQAVGAFLPVAGDKAAPKALREAQGAVRDSVEQMTDVALHALSQQDRGIASQTCEALKGITTTYLAGKQKMDPSWFALSDGIRHSPELEILSEESVSRLERDASWVEWMVLRQLLTIFQASLNRMRDVVRLVSINVRQVGEHALAQRDQAVIDLSVRYFNSFLRSAMNAGDVRSAYNTLDQYRHLAESALADGQEQTVDWISKNLAYYGRTASHMGLPFVTESVAYDLEALCEKAHACQSQVEQKVLERLLTVDEVPDSPAGERSLRGVRKAQIKLGCYYLSQGAEDTARLIAEDMEHEDRERLEQLREELLAAVQPDFWEVVDRGKNFDYLSPELREQVPAFYRMLDQAIAG